MKDLETLFYEKVRKTDSCWEWIGSLIGNGYGRFWVKGDKGGKWLYAHRLSWMIHYDEEPTMNLWVLHKCDNPPCVRPDHLWLGTPSDNSQDREDKGRSNKIGVRGENSHFSKLIEKQVLEIRELYKPRIITRRMLAEFYNTSVPNIEHITSRKTWKHI